MIRQPEHGTRNVNDLFYESEAKQIALLNDVLSDVELSIEERTLIWLAGWEECTVANIVSVIRKAKKAAVTERLEQPQ